MKITLGTKELEKIVGEWATDRYDAGLPSVKIVKRRDSIDVIIDDSEEYFIFMPKNVIKLLIK